MNRYAELEKIAFKFKSLSIFNQKKKLSDSNVIWGKINNQYGYCNYGIEPNNTAIIFDLYIEPMYRKKGHAKQLIEQAIKEIRQHGYNKEITIEADPTENSIELQDLVAFYNRMGLKVIRGKVI